LAALLHDAAEYVIGDMISPFKVALGLDYRTFENRLEGAIHIRFGLPATTPGPIASLIKAADRASACLEATQLAGFSAPEALTLFGPAPDGCHPSMKAQSPADAAQRYLQRFHVLSEAAGFAPGLTAFDTE
jgi:5'-deoxynucleotidase YfbR-like HD superfamily hydrolase